MNMMTDRRGATVTLMMAICRKYGGFFQKKVPQSLSLTDLQLLKDVRMKAVDERVDFLGIILVTA